MTLMLDRSCLLSIEERLPEWKISRQNLFAEAHGEHGAQDREKHQSNLYLTSIGLHLEVNDLAKRYATRALCALKLIPRPHKIRPSNLDLKLSSKIHIESLIEKESDRKKANHLEIKASLQRSDRESPRQALLLKT